MGILDDIKRLGLKLNEEDNKELEALFDRAKAEKADEVVTKTKIEYYIGEYLTVIRPDIMKALEKDKEARNNEHLREMNKRFNEQGKRICDETGCTSVEGVDQCPHCERFICAQHNYGQGGGPLCYACSIELKNRKS